MLALPADSISPESARALEERTRGWSSALFPIRSQQSTANLTDNGNGNGNGDASAVVVPSTGMSVDFPSTNNAAGSLFVRRSSDRGRND
jgi:hypothetical protein